MDIKAYIESGILELYVAGTLSEKENEEVYVLMQQHHEILQEVLEIEAAVIKLTVATSTQDTNRVFNTIKQELNFKGNGPKVISIAKPKYNWLTYTGWAASIILGIGLFWAVNQNKQLQTDIQVAETQQSLLETQIESSKNSLKEANTLVNVLRDDNIPECRLQVKVILLALMPKYIGIKMSNVFSWMPKGYQTHRQILFIKYGR